jgi:hypothetical protein
MRQRKLLKCSGCIYLCILSLLLSRTRPETQIKYPEFLHQICDRPLKGRGGFTPVRLCAIEDLEAGKLFRKRRLREII